MTEEQDIQVVAELGTDTWYFIEEQGKYKIYQTDNNQLFALDTESETKIHFEVYEENGEFQVY